MLRSLILIISLLAAFINGITVVVNDPPSDTTPPCLRQCLRSYAEYAPAHGSACEPSDNNCVCRDPLLAVFVACCLSDSCSEEAPAGAAYLDFQCRMSGVLLPDLADCDGAKKAQKEGAAVTTVAVTLYSTESDGRLRSVMVAGSTSRGGGGTATKESSSSVASSTKSSQPVASDTSTASNSITTTSPPSGPATTNPPAPPAAGTTSKPNTSAQSAPSHTTNAASSSSATSSTAGSPPSTQQSAKPLTLGLSIGLGVPLSIAAVGVISFILYRRRKQQAFESDSFFMGGPYVSPGQGQSETTYASEWKPEMPGGNGGYAAQRAGVGRWEGSRIEMPS